MRRTPLSRALLIVAHCIPSLALAQNVNDSAERDAPAVLPVLNVTASKQGTTRFDTPNGVSIIDSGPLETYRYENMGDIAVRTPNTYLTAYAPSTPQLTIRGLGFSDDESDSTSTSTFIDGIPVTGMALGQPFDLEQVEILRGPQSTLYGQGSMGGVVALRSRDPGFEAGGHLQLDYGSYQRQRVEVAGDLPLSDRTTVRVVAGGEESDGYTENARLNNEGADWRSGFGRIKLLHIDDNDGEWRLGLHHFQSRGGNDYFTAQSLASHHQSDNTTPGRNDIEYTLVSGEYRRKLDNDRNLVVLLGGSQSNWNYWMPDSALGAKNGFDAKTRQFSAESRLSGVAGDFDWLVGGYASHLEREAPYLYDMGPAFVSSTTADVTGNTAAGFGELGWHLQPEWRIAAALRAEHNRREMGWTSLQAGDGFSQQQRLDNLEVRDTVVLPRLTLEYQPDDRHYSWLTLARGYKASGFNVYATDADSASQSYAPVYGNYAELGYRLRDAKGVWEVEGNVFYTRLRDQQVVLIGDQNQSLTDNAGKSHNAGVELSATLRPWDSVELQAFAAWVEAEYDEYATGGIDYAGTQFPNAPRNSQGISARWEPSDHWSLGLSAVRQAQSFLYPDSHHTNDAFTLIDANVGYRFDNWAVGLYGKNLSDETYFTRALSDTFVAGAPRTVGISLSMDF